MSRAEFIINNTTILPVPLVPEIRLHLAHEAVPLWQKTEEELGEMGLPPPFWAFAWAGGQALARYILDHGDVVAGQRVLDLATGSGLVGIAAMKARAVKVTAADIDSYAVVAAGLNAALNKVSLDIVGANLLDAPPLAYDVILVGDLFYEKGLATQVLAWLRLAQKAGTVVLIGDPGRAYLPKDSLQRLADYQVPVTRDLEDAEIKQTAVWRLV